LCSTSKQEFPDGSIHEEPFDPTAAKRLALGVTAPTEVATRADTTSEDQSSLSIDVEATGSVPKNVSAEKFR
jgi:hypothetical protein